MAANMLSDAERRNLRAQSLGYRNEYDRRSTTNLLRNIGYSLGNQANRRALEGYLDAVNRMSGLPGRAQPTRDTMSAFVGLVQRTGLNRQYSGQSVSALLEDRGLINIEDQDWDEWWSAYV
jgi:hypothetical protein